MALGTTVCLCAPPVRFLLVDEPVDLRSEGSVRHRRIDIYYVSEWDRFLPKVPERRAHCLKLLLLLARRTRSSSFMFFPISSIVTLTDRTAALISTP